MKENQESLFDNPPAWTEQWEGMPEFNQKNELPYDAINVQFKNAEDRRQFLLFLGENPARRKSIWYPSLGYAQMSKRSTEATTVEANKYPVFVISKGRWESRHTAKSLEKLGIPFHIVVEPQEYDSYAAVMDEKTILTLPFSNLGQGSIPARNWVWQFAKDSGAARHWILDDNIDGFYCLNNNEKAKVIDRNPFLDAESISDRYGNVAVSGLNYEFFAMRRAKVPPFYLNTRVYSCILINNAIGYRWRGRYNEDTDLCIRALKDGWCTILLNYMLAKKLPTMTVKGGNTEELYKDDGRLKMAESLREQHPDIVKVTEKWGRFQHHVDYSVFKKNKLQPRSEA